MSIIDSAADLFWGAVDYIGNIADYAIDNPDAVAFACIAIVAVASAIFVVASKEAVHSAFYLALTMVCVAITYFFLEAEFVGVVQLMVYVGAVTIVFAFSIMLTKTVIMGKGDDDE